MNLLLLIALLILLHLVTSMIQLKLALTQHLLQSLVLLKKELINAQESFSFSGPLAPDYPRRDAIFDAPVLNFWQYVAHSLQ